ncbi:TPM domain-containing protein [Hymenobacter convexus]|uniref:TPM domain-containing protein n=1 Tax=Hymenobacter sp. CA1UV-4 TaxID=3063782 RepID=UPI0027122E21|nr:TPM domain-containing protein [Hymenobacter sp. CA1UV-4]MDO7852028.1 TPM domain-containing protein [Hymenobacter sp. CA1UV-4]
MKMPFRWLLSFWLLLLGGSGVRATVPPAALPPRPEPARFVNDLAGVLSGPQRLALEQKLQAYNDSTTTQIAVVLMKTVAPYEVAEYAQQLGEKWGVGQKGRNNGIVILAAIEEHRVTIQTGYGMEARVPDYVTAQIIAQQFQPDFRLKRYYEGLDHGIDVIIHRAAGEFSPFTPHPAPWSEQPWWVWLIFLTLVPLGLGVMYIMFFKVGFRGRSSGSGPRSPLSSSSGGGSSSSGSSSSFGGGSFGGGGSSGGW